MTFPWEYIELMIIVGEKRDVRAIESMFLVVPFKRVYKYILDRPFMIALDVMESHVHIKPKFHNIHTINVNL